MITCSLKLLSVLQHLDFEGKFAVLIGRGTISGRFTNALLAIRKPIPAVINPRDWEVINILKYIFVYTEHAQAVAFIV